MSRGKYKVLGEVLFYKIKNNYDIIDIQYKKELESLYYKNMEEYYAQSMVWRQGNVIYNTSVYFRNQYKDGWITDDFTRAVIKDI